MSHHFRSPFSYEGVVFVPQLCREGSQAVDVTVKLKVLVGPYWAEKNNKHRLDKKVHGSDNIYQN